MSNSSSLFQPIRIDSTSPAFTQLVATANDFVNNAIAASTRATYASGVNSYISFCKEYGIVPSLPISDEYLCLWASHVATRTLAAHGKGPLAYKTIKSYSHGISSFHTELGFDNWLDSLLLFPRCLKGIKRSLGEKDKRKRLPITTSLLARLRANLDLSSYPHALFWAAATAATYGLLRMGEFCYNNQKEMSSEPHGQQDHYKLLTLNQLTLFNHCNETVPLSSSHLYATVAYYTLALRTSKTDPFRKGVIIRIAHPTAITAMLSLLLQHPCALDNGCSPLFVETAYGGKVVALSRDTMITMTRTAMSILGLDPSAYHGHSFRRGGATSLAEKGVPDAMIQVLGRWLSQCYKLYIDLPLDQVLAANRSM
jgi:hypothetical protein